MGDVAGRRCVFCMREGDLSKEHVMPRWIWREAHGGDPVGRTIEDDAPSKYRETFVEYAGEIIRMVEPRSEQPLMRSTALTVRVVCRTCNNGWMSQLEADTKPIFIRMNRDRSWRLAPEEVRTVRRWVIKTALMLEHSDGDYRIATPEMFKAIAQNSDPPGSWYIGLGRAHREVQFRVTSSPLFRRMMSANEPTGMQTEVVDEQVFATHHVVAPWQLFFIVRYSPYPVIPPARLDHDLVRRPGGRPLPLDEAAFRRRYRLKDLPTFTSEDIDLMSYWGHSRDSRGGINLGRDDAGGLAIHTPLGMVKSMRSDYEEVTSKMVPIWRE